jgi:ATP-dependent DNA helicase DinG
MGWREHFPYPTVRDEQARVLDEIVGHIEAGRKQIVLEAGTGVGKSAIAVALAGYVRERNGLVAPGGRTRGAYILTSQKTLQDQYRRDFPNLGDIRSSSNYVCKDGPGETCAQTMRFKKHEAKSTQAGKDGAPVPTSCSGCVYRESKNHFLGSKAGITNYSYFTSETVYAGEIEPRELIILDEAHNVEDEMRRWATVEIDEERATKYGCEFPFGSKPAQAVDWVSNQYGPRVSNFIATHTKELDKISKGKGILSKLAKQMLEELEMLDKHLCQVNRFLNEFGTPKDSNLVTWEEEMSGRRILKIRPLECGPMAQDLLYPMGDVALLMSATILDQKVFSRSAGLKDAVFVSEPSPFPAEAFGIVYRPAGKMSKRFIQGTIPAMVRSIERILKEHPDDKGIIHCASYEVARAVGRIRNDRLLVQTSAKDREFILKEHSSSKRPTVIVSPSMMEGLDLDGDLGRIQIICKIPFPNIGDPVISAKMNKDREWYAWRTARSVIQAAGRCVRSKDDWTKTYILDESFGDFFVEWNRFFPPHFHQMDVDV